jgi:uncharacterized protein
MAMSGLQFNVAQLLKGGIGETRAYDFQSDEPLSLDDIVATEVRGRVKFTLTNYGIVAGIEASALLDLTCARCLEPFRFPAAIRFEEEYQPVIDIATGLPSETPKSDGSFGISPTHTIDLGEAIRQHLLLAVEMIPLCRPDCKGLCPTCGTNLNNGQCACPPAEEPSPFAALRSLLQEAEAE